MNEALIPDSPVVIPESIVVHPDGELPRGLYYYVITAVGDRESIPSHILQVYAPNKNNSIEFEWNKIPGIKECRIYRGTVLGKYDGYFYAGSQWFCDDGMGELNLNICEK
jgi:hypothetical protein